MSLPLRKGAAGPGGLPPSHVVASLPPDGSSSLTRTAASFQRTPVVYCVRLARALVDDYCCLVPGSVQTLKQIFNASPRFCCQFVTSVTALYDLSSGTC